MANLALVSVGDYDFPEPSSYSGNTSTLVNAGRNAEGYMVGSVIRASVAKVELSWKYLTIQQWADIQKCFDENRGGNFISLVRFFDQSAGGWSVAEMYVSDRKAGMWRRDPDTGAVLGWTNCSLSLVEI